MKATEFDERFDTGEDMSQLAIAAIKSGEERILSPDILGGDRLLAVLGEPV